MKHIILLLAFAALCLSGCNNRVYLSGTVTYEEDGSPVKSGSVNFDAGEKGFFSGTIKDGKYKMSDGVLPGQYKVWLAGVQDLEYTNKDAPEGSVAWFAGQHVIPLLAEEYASSARTPLSFEVKPGGAATYDIAVKKPKTPGRR